MRKVRLASIVPYKIFPPLLGGQRAIALFCKYISRQVPFTCITTQSNEAKLADGYTVANLLSNSALRYINPLYFFTIRKLVKQQQITHVLIEHPYYGWLGLLLQKFAGVKLVVRSHNIEGLRWKTLGKKWWPLLWRYERYVHRNADYSFFMQDDDRLYAIEQFKVPAQKCITVTYGIEWQTPPSPHEKLAARNALIQKHAIPPDHHIFLFNGAFAYPPNLKGLEKILHEINPALQTYSNYTILICGKDIPVTNNTYPNVIFAGFVDDVSLYFKGADVFINPITEGGGIKTKLVEALGYNLNAVSSSHGAIGIDPGICGGKLMLTDQDFAAQLMQLASYKANIPPAFFEHFYWGHIAEKAASFISETR